MILPACYCLQGQHGVILPACHCLQGQHGVILHVGQLQGVDQRVAKAYMLMMHGSWDWKVTAKVSNAACLLGMPTGWSLVVVMMMVTMMKYLQLL